MILSSVPDEAAVQLRAYAHGLHQLADLLTYRAPELAQSLAGSYMTDQLDVCVDKPEDLAGAARIPGGWEKVSNDYLYGVARTLGALPEGVLPVWEDRAGVTFRVVIGRDNAVCEKRPTGRKVRSRRVVTPAVYADVEVDEFEWVCPPVLAAAEADV